MDLKNSCAISIHTNYTENIAKLQLKIIVLSRNGVKSLIISFLNPYSLYKEQGAKH